MANIFTKQVTARAAVNARPAPHNANTILTPTDESSALRRNVWSVSHSLTKPLNGGNAAIESAPARKAAPVQGIRRIRPPSRSRFRVPAHRSTSPAPINKRALYREWLVKWYSATRNAIAAKTGFPTAEKTRPAPKLTAITPAFSIELCASKVFRLLLVVA